MKPFHPVLDDHRLLSLDHLSLQSVTRDRVGDLQFSLLDTSNKTSILC
jgi:hypothetical protein